MGVLVNQPQVKKVLFSLKFGCFSKIPSTKVTFSFVTFENFSEIPAVWRQEFVSVPVFPQEVVWPHAQVPLTIQCVLENSVLLIALVAL